MRLVRYTLGMRSGWHLTVAKLHYRSGHISDRARKRQLSQDMAAIQRRVGMFEDAWRVVKRDGWRRNHPWREITCDEYVVWQLTGK